MDLYVFATPYRITWDYYFTAREHTLQIESWEESAEPEYQDDFIVCGAGEAALSVCVSHGIRNAWNLSFSSGHFATFFQLCLGSTC
ncbi:hypothetical protein Dimus_031618 [Dionaea muscipula]